MTVNQVVEDALLLARYGIAAAEAVVDLGAATLIGPFDFRASQSLSARWVQKQRTRFGITVNVVDNSCIGAASPPYVFVQLNQTTLAEILIWPVELPAACRVVVNLEFAFLPFVGWSLVAQGCPVVVRQWPAQARRAINRAKGMLRDGHAIALSIEGKRSADGRLSSYKKGPSVLAIETQATIVPFVLRGARDLLPYGAWRLRAGHVEIEFLPAIATAGLTLSDRDALTAKLRSLAETHLCRDRYASTRTLDR